MMWCVGVGVECFEPDDLVESGVILLDDAIQLSVEVRAYPLRDQLLKKVRIDFAEGDALVDHSFSIEGQLVELNVHIRLGMRQ